MADTGEQITVAEYFAGMDTLSCELFDAVRRVAESLGEVEVRATKSQVAFRRRIGFAWVWIPGQYLRRSGLAPLVLTVGLNRRDASPRWKQVVEPQPGHFTHHLELYSVDEIDDEVAEWLREAWREAG